VEEAVSKQVEGIKPTLLDNLAALWPGIRYLGLGVLFSWIHLSNGGIVWLSTNESNGASLSTVFLISTATAAAILLSSPLCIRFFKSLLKSRGRVILFGSCAVIGSFLIIVSGPYYLNIRMLSYLGAFLNGISMAVLFLKCGVLYGALKPRTALIYTALSLCLVSLVYFFVLGNSAFVPREGGPALGGILAFIFMPLLTSLLVTIPPPSQVSTFLTAVDENELTETSRSLRFLPPAFWKFMVAIFIFTIAASTIQGFTVEVNHPSMTLAASNSNMLLLFAFAIIVIFYAVHFLRQGNLGKLYLLAMVILTAVMSISPLFDITNSPFVRLVGFTFSMFDFFVWCLLAFIAFQKRISPVIAFGFGRGIFMTAMSLGSYFGGSFMPLLKGTRVGMTVYLVLSVAILVVVTLVFKERDIAKVLTPSSLSTTDPAAFAEQPFDQLQADCAINWQSNEKARNPERPFNQACLRIGQAARLSGREQSIFEQLALGRGSEGIAKRLHISLNTVRTHTHNIYAKLDVHSRQELIELVEAEHKRFENV
jgi:DNA-binding CsgD family transcriptional regulator